MTDQAIKVVSIALLSLAIHACANPKRTVYESLESIRIQQCLNQAEDTPDCSSQRQRYDQYEAEYRQQTGSERSQAPE